MQAPAAERRTPPTPRPSLTPFAWTVGCGVAAILIWTHPYAGIRHDGLLYSVQALRRLYPEGLGGDLYFRHGSQDAYTVFSPLYAALVRWLGLEAAAALIVVTSLAALCASALMLSRRLMPASLAGLSLLLFVLVPGEYGAQGLLSYVEDFVTPRPLAEALGLTGIALTLSNRARLALVPFLAAVVLHPLMALPTLLAAFLCRAGDWSPRQQFAAGVVVAKCLAAILLLGAFGVMPCIDPPWRAVLAWQSPYLFADGWTITDWSRAALVMASLATTLQICGADRARRLAASAMAVGAGGLILGCIATWLLPVAVLVQLQPWRWLWIAKAVAVLLAVPTAAELIGRGRTGYPVIALLALAWVTEGDALSIAASLGALLVLMFGARVTPASGRIVLAAAATGFGIWVARHGFPVRPAVAVLVVVGWWSSLPERTQIARRAAAVIAASALVIVVAIAASRPAPPNHDGAALALRDWSARIGPEQTVLFLGNPTAPWLVLHRRSYVSLSPGVFSRATALELRARYERYREAMGSEVDWFHQGGWPAELGAPTLVQLARVCALPDLDFIAGPLTLPVPSLASEATAPFNGLRLYDCRDVRRAAAPGSASGDAEF